MAGRIMALDYGAKTVGVAISDALGLTAQGKETIWRKQENQLRQTLTRIETLAYEHQVTLVIVGNPKNMNNTLSERSEKSLLFKKKLEDRLNISVKLWDERLTTAQARRVLQEERISAKEQKKSLDQMAAILILQNYLDWQHWQMAASVIPSGDIG
ncbi:putative pre-16S rRNA nuclease [Clostridia bacterium]|nr:putative pre-16S rRNA nuclease [Clostridia bacterium]